MYSAVKMAPVTAREKHPGVAHAVGALPSGAADVSSDRERAWGRAPALTRDQKAGRAAALFHRHSYNM